jgi:proteic killer suppression protein
MALLLLVLDANSVLRYYIFLVIRHFADSDTEKLFRGQKPRRLPIQVLGSALRKLLILNAAESLEDLRIPPGNRLERLKGDRRGQYSIRINDQWRICFEWRNGDAYAVEITDYHS